MLSKRHQKIFLDLMSLPTAPFVEYYVRQYIFNFCQNRPRVKIREDRAGNILVHYQHPAAKLQRPVCLCAHTDHPGFRAARMSGQGLLKAKWYGGVPPEYFPKAKVKFFSDDQWIYGQLGRLEIKNPKQQYPQKKVQAVEVEILRPKKARIKPGSPGMWNLPEPHIKGQRIYGLSCDDCAGVSAMLSCLDILVRSRKKTEAYFLFTRAEEVGFVGAIAACENRTIPKKCLVVAIETSSVIPGVEMGNGPILRVGDKSSIFAPDLTAWCRGVADELAQKDKKFIYQRKLMDGGSCESTAYCQLGYDATGICLALGNYHNCDRTKKKLALEFIHLEDQANMIKWFVALVSCKARMAKGDPAMQKKLGQLKRQHQKLLNATA